MVAAAAGGSIAAAGMCWHITTYWTDWSSCTATSTAGRKLPSGKDCLPSNPLRKLSSAVEGLSQPHTAVITGASTIRAGRCVHLAEQYQQQGATAVSRWQQRCIWWGPWLLWHRRQQTCVETAENVGMWPLAAAVSAQRLPSKGACACCIRSNQQQQSAVYAGIPTCSSSGGGGTGGDVQDCHCIRQH